MSSPDPSLDPFDSYEHWNPYDDLSQQQTQTNNLKFCQFSDWDSEGTYDDDPPIYIHYSIEYKITLNNRAIMGPDTVQDIVLAPAAYWEHFLQPKLDDFWRSKKRSVRSEDTNIVVSVTQRKEPPLTKRFADTSIDLAVVENQLASFTAQESGRL
jgi:hypothetical protein